MRQDKFEDTKGIIRGRNSGEGQTIQWQKEKGQKRQTMVDIQC